SSTVSGNVRILEEIRQFGTIRSASPPSPWHSSTTHGALWTRSVQQLSLSRFMVYCASNNRRTPYGRFTVYQNCPLPTPEERLFFILTSLKTYALQVVRGRLFGMRQ